MVQVDGKGGMVYGTLNLTEDTTYYLYIGKSGTYGGQAGFNGSGSSGSDTSWYYEGGGSGGGATDIRTVSGSWDDSKSLQKRILVAGGGGGGRWPAE